MKHEDEACKACEHRHSHKPAKTRLRTTIAVAAVVGLLAGGAGAYAASGFDDVQPGHEFEDEIAWMADTGISTGYTDGTFRPQAPVTRQAMSAFMQRLFDLQVGKSEVTTRENSDGYVQSTTGDSPWTRVNDMTTTVEVPPGTTARLSSLLTAEGNCNGGNDITFSGFDQAPNCRVMLTYAVLGCVPIQCLPVTMQPGSATVLSSNLHESQRDDNVPDDYVQQGSFAYGAASGIVGPGTYQVALHIQVSESAVGNRLISFDLDAATLRVDVLLESSQP